jgi:cell shape-determining protein MreC
MLLVAVGVLITTSLMPARWAKAVEAVPGSVVRALTKLPAEALTGVSGAVRREPELAVDLGPRDKVEQENLALKQYVQNLEQQLAIARQDIARLSQLPEELNLRGIKPLTARVMATPTGARNTEPLLTISRGTRHGVGPGQVVTDGFNLVGVVERAYAGSAEVKLISTSGTRLTARIVPPTAMADGGRSAIKPLTAAADGRFFTTDGQNLVVGDLAHLWDTKWPAEAGGFVLGKVTRIDQDPANPLMFLVAVIEPLVPLDQLHSVNVLIPRESE